MRKYKMDVSVIEKIGRCEYIMKKFGCNEDLNYIRRKYMVNEKTEQGVVSYV